jgi:hypothetical protein
MPVVSRPTAMSSRLFLLSLLLGGTAVALAGCGIIGGGSAVTAEDSRAPRDLLDQVIVVQATNGGPEFCFDSLKNRECSGGVKVGTTNITFFSGATCEQVGLTSDAKAGDKISITCEKDGKPCFSGVDKESTVAIDSKLTADFGSGKWITGQDLGVYANRKEGSCADAWRTTPQNPPQPDGDQDQCEEQTPAAPLRLANELPTVSECLKISGPARMNCLLQQNAAEIYDYSTASASDVEAIKRGERSPNRCYANFPNASSTSKHFFVYLSGGGYKGAIALGTAGVGSSPNSLRYDFTRFNSPQVPYPAVSVGRAFDELTPASDNGGEPDLATGVWVMSNRRVARFVPKSWCAQKYLGGSLDLSELQSVQLDAKQPVSQPGGGQPAANPQPKPCTPKTK